MTVTLRSSRGYACHTLVCLFLASQESPSLIHIPTKVLFSISHSCQILEEQKTLHFLWRGLCGTNGEAKGAARVTETLSWEGKE